MSFKNLKSNARRRVALDLVPIRVGEGGTGSGIWTYARELLHAMDGAEFEGIDLVALVNDGQLPYLEDLRNIRLIRFPTFGKNIALRLLWIHLFLPLICLFRRIEILHKLATETPLFCPAKRVTTLHDFYYEFLLENHSSSTIRLYERLENLYFSLTTRTCFKKSRALIAVSEATRQEAMRRYPASEERIQVVHHGAPEIREEQSEYGDPSLGSPFQPPTSNLQPDTFLILCVAKFMEHKGQLWLVEAFDALLEQIPERVGSVRLVLRGFHNDEAYYEALCRQISSSPFSEYIQMVGFNPTDLLEEIYSEADLVVLLSSYEGFGLPVLEAQGMGIPVLCSDLPVLQEVGGEGAAYVGREDVLGVARALRRFVEDSEYYEVMKVRALDNVRRFSWASTAQRTLDIYVNC